MGAVVSCIESVFRTIGSVLMAIVNGIGSILMAIINGIVAFLDIVISFVTCGYCGGGRRGGGTRTHRTSRVYLFVQTKYKPEKTDGRDNEVLRLETEEWKMR
ncbi:hypothetical protein F5Y16DRAFT_405707 [Xylariaceae sp. FL0255]|nr:hypothetical protein F5Y16DRAFT_405707 [Xylariaceae sp. FL0255]